jgi:hypothetical protein
MRTLFGAGTPRAAADLRLLWLTAGDHLLLVLLAPQITRSTSPGSAALAVIAISPIAPDDGALSTAS